MMKSLNRLCLAAIVAVMTATPAAAAEPATDNPLGYEFIVFKLPDGFYRLLLSLTS